MSAPTLRPYQRDAIDAARARFVAGDRATLLVLPTGAGKTVIFARIARLTVASGNTALVLVHRRELVRQAVDKLRRAAPDARIEVEQGRDKASPEADIVVASVQTLSRTARLETWDPDAFALVIVDEAHHATAASYARVLDHFGRAWVLGVTATPDRADGTSLAAVFESVAYSRDMLDLIAAGYLVPLSARTVHVDAFDLGGVRIVGGDFDHRGISDALAEPGVVDTLADLLIEHHEDRSTLVFVAGVERAHELAAALNERQAGGAVAVDGTTPQDERDGVFRAFDDGAVRFLVNVGVATEGTDLPRCSCVAVVRPTMSRGLFVQMVGRGVRLHPGKADCLVLSFAPSNARHRLMVATDALLPVDTSEDTREAAARAMAAGAAPGDAAQLAIVEQPARERESAVGAYRATLESWDPFAVVADALDLGAIHEQERPGEVAPATLALLERRGVPAKVRKRLTPALADALVAQIEARKRAGLSTLKQARTLSRYGLHPDVTFAVASEAIDQIARAGWKRLPPALRADPRFRTTTTVPAPIGARSFTTEGRRS